MTNPLILVKALDAPTAKRQITKFKSRKRRPQEERDHLKSAKISKKNG